MPTGYTAVIDDNKDVTFADYVWRCARAFGALIHMRDDSFDAEIREPEQSTYYRNALKGAQADLKKYESMTVEEATRRAKADYEESWKSWNKAKAENAAVRARYDGIKEQVQAWNPPTVDHRNLKDFMREQLNTGGPGDYYDDPERAPKLKPGKQWLESQLQGARRDIEYYTKNLKEEQERNADRGGWIRDLQASVPMPKKIR